MLPWKYPATMVASVASSSTPNMIRLGIGGSFNDDECVWVVLSSSFGW